VNVYYDGDAHSVTWNSVGIKTKYYLYTMPLSGGQETLIYEGYDRQISHSSSGVTYRLYMEFEPFNLRTDFFE